MPDTSEEYVVYTLGLSTASSTDLNASTSLSTELVLQQAKDVLGLESVQHKVNGKPGDEASRGKKNSGATSRHDTITRTRSTARLRTDTGQTKWQQAPCALKTLYIIGGLSISIAIGMLLSLAAYDVYQQQGDGDESPEKKLALLGNAPEGEVIGITKLSHAENRCSYCIIDKLMLETSFKDSSPDLKPLANEIGLSKHFFTEVSRQAYTDVEKLISSVLFKQNRDAAVSTLQLIKHDIERLRKDPKGRKLLHAVFQATNKILNGNAKILDMGWQELGPNPIACDFWSSMPKEIRQICHGNNGNKTDHPHDDNTCSSLFMIRLAFLAKTPPMQWVAVDLYKRLRSAFKFFTSPGVLEQIIQETMVPIAEHVVPELQACLKDPTAKDIVLEISSKVKKLDVPSLVESYFLTGDLQVQQAGLLDHETIDKAVNQYRSLTGTSKESKGENMKWIGGKVKEHLEGLWKSIEKTVSDDTISKASFRYVKNEFTNCTAPFRELQQPSTRAKRNAIHSRRLRNVVQYGELLIPSKPPHTDADENCEEINAESVVLQASPDEILQNMKALRSTDQQRAIVISGDQLDSNLGAASSFTHCVSIFHSHQLTNVVKAISKGAEKYRRTHFRESNVVFGITDITRDHNARLSAKLGPDRSDYTKYLEDETERIIAKVIESEDCKCMD